EEMQLNAAYQVLNRTAAEIERDRLQDLVQLLPDPELDLTSRQQLAVDEWRPRHPLDLAGCLVSDLLSCITGRKALHASKRPDPRHRKTPPGRTVFAVVGRFDSRRRYPGPGWAVRRACGSVAGIWHDCCLKAYADFVAGFGYLADTGIIAASA